MTLTVEEPLTGTYVSRSRGARRHSYFVLTPANHFPGRLPHFESTVVRRLVTPRSGTARFGQYLFDIDPGGGTTRPLAGGFEHFVYVLSGDVTVDVGSQRAPLGPGGYAYAPGGAELGVRATGEQPVRVLLLKRRYEPWPDVDAPAPLIAARDDAPALPTSVAGLDRRELLPPDDPSYDFNVSLLGFEAGTCFHKVEVHDEEHGLYMTEGQGIYHLDGEAHEVVRDDFVYMAPYCPQYFYALGPGRSEYLLYKDVWRDGFSEVA